MKYVFLILTGLIGFSCSNGGGQSAENDLTGKFKEVMIVHDEVMPRMQEVRKLSKELDAKRDLLAADSTQAILTNETIQAAFDSLEIIETEMMQWMHSFEAEQSPGTTNEERLAYLEERKLAMEKLGEHFERNIRYVEDLLK